MVKIICISTARKKSESVKNKNTILIKKKPLYRHNIDSALKVSLINDIAITTDIKIPENLKRKIYVIKRTKKLSLRSASHKKTIIDCLFKVEKKTYCKYDIVVLVLGNSLGANSKDLKKSINIILKNNKINSVISVIKLNMFNPQRAFVLKNNLLNNFLPKFFFSSKKQKNDKNNYGNFYFFNGSFMIFRRDCLFKNGMPPFDWIGNKIFPYVQKKTYMEVDDYWQKFFLQVT
jgi:CMP-N,N'-diacetyllegionaminic acid synthase